LALARAGTIICPWFADAHPELKRITPVTMETGLNVWVLTHPNLRDVKRNRVLKNLLIELFESKEEHPS